MMSRPGAVADVMTDAIRVLVVDDEPDFARLTAEFLERDGSLTVVTETDPQTALERLREGTFACVVSDFDMREMDGLELLERVREMRPDLPFILFTGKGSEEIASEAISAGVTDYLQKRGGSDQYAVLANRVTNAAERYRTQQEAERVRNRLEAINEANPDYIFIFNEAAEYEEILAGANEITTYAPESFIGQGVGDLWPDEPAAEIRQAIRATIETGERQRIEYKLPLRGRSDRSDRIAWYEGRTAPVDLPGTDRPHVLLTAREITERRDQDRELRAFRKAVENAGHQIYLTDDEGTIEYVNAAFEERTGYDREEAVGRTPRILKSGEHGDAFYADLWDTISRGAVWENEVVNQTKDGERYVVHQTVAPIEGPDGDVDRYVAVNRDITERKRRERALEEERAKYATLAEQSNDAVAVVRDRRIAFANERLGELLGHDPSALLGMDVDSFVAAEDQDLVLDRYEHRIDDDHATPPSQYEVKFVRSDGERRVAEISVAPITYEGDAAVLTTARDITDRKERERALEREKERHREFAGVLAHELGTQLNVALGKLRLADKEAFDHRLNAVEVALQRMDEIIQRTMTLSRYGTPVEETTRVDLGMLAGHCWSRLETETATLVREEPPEILADRERIQHLLENLFQNAVDHTGPGVEVRIGPLPDGFYVADDGDGLPPDLGEDAFEAGRGSPGDGFGIGLTIVRRVVEAHGWSIDLATPSDGGTRFEVRNVDRP